jgi:hypothetical protein
MPTSSSREPRVRTIVVIEPALAPSAMRADLLALLRPPWPSPYADDREHEPNRGEHGWQDEVEAGRRELVLGEDHVNVLTLVTG